MTVITAVYGVGLCVSLFSRPPPAACEMEGHSPVLQEGLAHIPEHDTKPDALLRPLHRFSSAPHHSL